ncbi:hypothetical protein KM176_12200 [Pseudooceanicola sp. CBS1P-1]|uniref:Uncharacterized protein n=1 Tax=Pseudooceanicola albus TaxID=2692189 RepID=A0A6L7G2K6_9RHOB|nr:MULTISPECIES: hypothetical protein [Pseudooceanicola]MBT9384624.1 hypothetical protein [Pseudooceanicola endophyticus]MXN18325.1 hypothetical protein [Pseudooceanicola albus]
MGHALWEEYTALYAVYEGYNDQFLTLKGWSVTVGLAALMGAYALPPERHGRLAVLLAAFSALPFWLTEMFWRGYQAATMARLEEIERCMSGALFDRRLCSPYRILGAWQSAYRDHAVSFWLHNAWHPGVLLPHAVLLLAGLCLALWAPPGPPRR